MNGLGKVLILTGIAIALLGVLILLGDRLPFKIGRLPGDIVWERGNLKFYFPIATILIVNLVLWLLFRLFNRG